MMHEAAWVSQRQSDTGAGVWLEQMWSLVSCLVSLLPMRGRAARAAAVLLGKARLAPHAPGSLCSSPRPGACDTGKLLPPLRRLGPPGASPGPDLLSSVEAAHQGDLAVDLRRVFALGVGVLQGGQLQQAHAEAVHVHALVILLLVQLGSHELGGACTSAGLCVCLYGCIFLSTIARGPPGCITSLQAGLGTLHHVQGDQVTQWRACQVTGGMQV